MIFSVVNVEIVLAKVDLLKTCAVLMHIFFFLKKESKKEKMHASFSLELSFKNSKMKFSVPYSAWDGNLDYAES